MHTGYALLDLLEVDLAQTEATMGKFVSVKRLSDRVLLEENGELNWHGN